MANQNIVGGLLGNVVNSIQNTPVVGGLLGNLINSNKQSLSQPFSPYGPSQPAPKPLVGVTAKSPVQNIAPASNNISSQYMSDAMKASGVTPSKPLVNLPTKSTSMSTQSPQVPPPTSTVNPPSVSQPATPYTPQYNNTTTPTVGSIASQEANVINIPSPQVQQAQQELEALKNEYAQKGINIQDTAGFLTQAQGEQGLLHNQYLTALDAAQTKLENALTSQGQGISALGQAGQQVAPITASPGTSVYSPATGQFAPTLAGTQGTSGGQGLYGVGQLQNTADLGAQTGQLQATQRQIVGLGQNLNGLLASRPDINTLFGTTTGAYTFTPATGAVQLGARYLGDPGYQSFANIINDLTTRYAQILTPSGGNPTDTRLAIAQSLINPQATPQSIQQVLTGLDQQANSVISGLNPSGASSQQSVSTGGYNFVKNAQGQWVPAQ